MNWELVAFCQPDTLERCLDVLVRRMLDEIAEDDQLEISTVETRGRAVIEKSINKWLADYE